MKTPTAGRLKRFNWTSFLHDVGGLFLARLPPCQMHRDKLSAASGLRFLEAAGGGGRPLLNHRFCLAARGATAAAAGATHTGPRALNSVSGPPPADKGSEYRTHSKEAQLLPRVSADIPALPGSLGNSDSPPAGAAFRRLRE